MENRTAVRETPGVTVALKRLGQRWVVHKDLLALRSRAFAAAEDIGDIDEFQLPPQLDARAVDFYVSFVLYSMRPSESAKQYLQQPTSKFLEDVWATHAYFDTPLETLGLPVLLWAFVEYRVRVGLTQEDWDVLVNVFSTPGERACREWGVAQQLVCSDGAPQQVTHVSEPTRKRIVEFWLNLLAAVTRNQRRAADLDFATLVVANCRYPMSKDGSAWVLGWDGSIRCIKRGGGTATNAILAMQPKVPPLVKYSTDFITAGWRVLWKNPAAVATSPIAIFRHETNAYVARQALEGMYLGRKPVGAAVEGLTTEQFYDKETFETFVKSLS